MNVVLDTNSLLQILGARSKYAFLFDKFLREEYSWKNSLLVAILCKSRTEQVYLFCRDEAKSLEEMFFWIQKNYVTL